MSKCYTGCCDRPDEIERCHYCECCLRHDPQNRPLLKGYLRNAAFPIWDEKLKKWTFKINFGYGESVPWDPDPVAARIMQVFGDPGWK